MFVHLKLRGQAIGQAIYNSISVSFCVVLYLKMQLLKDQQVCLTAAHGLHETQWLRPDHTDLRQYDSMYVCMYVCMYGSGYIMEWW